MDNMKISADQAHRVSPSHSGAKERDEGYVASQTSAQESKNDIAVAKGKQTTNSEFEPSEDHGKNLIEQRKRSLAQELSEKDKASEQQKKNEELSAQRQIESRAAVNREKIKGSYNEVSHNEKQASDAAKNVEKDNQNRSSGDAADPINLVV